MDRNLDDLATWLEPRKRVVHIAVLLVTLLMIPGALRALEPIDVESYELDSPEMEAQEVINEEFATTEVILGFAVSVRTAEPGEVRPIPPRQDGTPDWAAFPPTEDILPTEMVHAADGAGPVGGVLNLSVLREIDAKADVVRAHALGAYLKPLLNEVTGSPSDGVMSLADIFRSFMNGSSILTRAGTDPFGNPVEPLTNWTDCGQLECLPFDDVNLTQAHIDLAGTRLTEARAVDFLRWTSSDRAFHPVVGAEGTGPLGGTLSPNGTWEDAVWVSGRWVAASSWLVVQLDRKELEADGWTTVWSDARQETSISLSDGFRVSGFRLEEQGLVPHPPNYTSELCLESAARGAPCSIEWSMNHMEGSLRSLDGHTVTLLLGQAVNVELNRELQGSAFLIAGMGLVIIVLLQRSLRRWSDVAIVGLGLGSALLWMQGMIGHLDWATSAIGWNLIERSQFSNLLPILVLALGIDDSLHALHRYREERASGASAPEASRTTLSRIGRAILLTSVTTMSAFAANLMSDIPALRSFGVEAALGILAAFLLTGLWVPLLRQSLDEWIEAREGQVQPIITHGGILPNGFVARLPRLSGRFGASMGIASIALLLTIPAAWGMAQLEGDFNVEDFLDSEADFSYGVHLATDRFGDEGEPAILLIEGDVAHPEVYAAIDQFRANLGAIEPGIPQKVTTTPDGLPRVIAIDDLVDLAIISLAENATPFEDVGWNRSSADHDVGCRGIGIANQPDLTDRGCLLFFYGFLSLYGVPATETVPGIPASITGVTIHPAQPLDPERPHRTLQDTTPTYEVMLLRFGITQPENFPTMAPGIAEIERDLEPFHELVDGDPRQRSQEPNGTEEDPLTWVMLTGRPITRWVAASSMQDQLQSSIMLGALFVITSLWWGFRDPTEVASTTGRALTVTFFLLSVWFLTSLGSDPWIVAAMAVLLGYASLRWGAKALGTAITTTVPILIVVIWLYGLIHLMGFSLNIVTVTIATLSLGVGIDYCIHVVERYRETRANGGDHEQGLTSIGGACAAALVGSAASDIGGFLVIATSPMGLFYAFGLLSAAMIGLSLLASLILTTATIGIMAQWESVEVNEALM